MGTFCYGGYHFTPVRKFTKEDGDWYNISKRVASDRDMGLCKYKDRQKFPYSFDGFYAASGNSSCDVFRCEENGRLYVPGTNELFLYN